ncbi:MAG: hypothetical protein GX160_08280 [Clostridiales bacterium]|nr:hypothetical protein [Clostridiales bacterium]
MVKALWYMGLPTPSFEMAYEYASKKDEVKNLIEKIIVLRHIARQNGLRRCLSSSVHNKGS